MLDRLRTFAHTRRGYGAIGVLILLGICVFNYFLNSVWSMLIIIAALAVVGWVQHHRERRTGRVTRY